MIQPDYRNPYETVWLNKNTWHPNQVTENYYGENVDYNTCPPCEGYSNLSVYGTVWSKDELNPKKQYCGGKIACTINPKPVVDYPDTFKSIGPPKWFSVPVPKGKKIGVGVQNNNIC